MKIYSSVALCSVAVACTAAVFKVEAGPYVGIGLGASVGSHSATLGYVQPFPIDPQSHTHGLTKISPAVNIALGYVGYVEDFVWGIDLDYTFGNINKSNLSNLGPGDTRLVRADSSGGAWGAGVRLGYRLSGVVTPFVRLGVESRRFRMQHISADVGFDGSFVEVSSNKRKMAFAPGVGVDFNVNKNLVLGLECRMAFYRAINASGRNTRLVGNERDVTYKLSPRVGTALMTLKYVWS